MTGFTNSGIQDLKRELEAKGNEVMSLFNKEDDGRFKPLSKDEKAKHAALMEDIRNLKESIQAMEDTVLVVEGQAQDPNRDKATIVGSQQPINQYFDPTDPNGGISAQKTVQPRADFKTLPIDDKVETVRGEAKGFDNSVRCGVRNFRSHFPNISEDEATANVMEQMNVFGKMLRRQPLDDKDRSVYNAMMAGTPNMGGHAVPDGFGSYIVELVRSASGVRQNANVQSFVGMNDVPWVTSNQTATKATIVAEGAAAGEQSPTIGQTTLKFDRWVTGFVNMTNRLLESAAFDMEAWIAGVFATQLASGQNDFFTNGTTIAAANVTGYIESAVAALTQTGASGQTTSVTYPDLVNVVYGTIDEGYARNAKWYMTRASLGKVIGLLDDQDRPIYVPGYVSGNPSTILGYEVVQQADQPTMAANALSIAFGDMREAYLIGDAVNSMMFHRIGATDGDYAKTGMQGFLLEQYSGGVTLQPNALGYYKNSSS